MKCTDCKFYHLGGCRRNPPLAVYIPNKNEIASVFPEIPSNEWCGEFSAKQAEAAKVIANKKK